MKLISSLVDLLVEKSCFVCGAKSIAPLCDACLFSINFLSDEICQRCGHPTAIKVDSCLKCRKNKIYYSQARSLLAYDDKSKEAVLALKLQNGFSLSSMYAKMAIKIIDPKFFEVDFITFIPQTLSKRAARGFNASELLARSFSYYLKKPVLDIFGFKKKVKDQVKLDVNQRKINLKDAFTIKRGIKIKEKYLIVDDIYTTGTTVNEASKLLFRDAPMVNVFTVGRTI